MCIFSLKYTIWIHLSMLKYTRWCYWKNVQGTELLLHWIGELCCQHRATHESTILDCTGAVCYQCRVSRQSTPRQPSLVAEVLSAHHGQQSQCRQGLLALSPGSWASSNCYVQMLAAWQDSHASSLRQSTESSTQQLWRKSAITCHWMQCQTNQPTNDCNCNHATANQSSC